MIYDWQTEFDFGKHEGETVGEVFDDDFSYLRWCVDAVVVTFAPHVAEAIRKEVGVD